MWKEEITGSCGKNGGGELTIQNRRAEKEGDGKRGRSKFCWLDRA